MDFNTIFFGGKSLNVLELFIRTSILYFLLFGSTKSMGFRQVGITTPYNFLMAAGISHIAAARMVDPKGRLIDAIVIIILYTLIHLLISYLYFKIPTIVSQKPVILVRKGKVLKENLYKLKLTIDNLFSILRQKNEPNIENVEYLIAESIGEFSIGINNNNLPVTKEDMVMMTNKDILPQILIYKGEIDKKVLRKNSLTNEWLKKELESKNIENINNIYLGILTSNKKLYINK